MSARRPTRPTIVDVANRAGVSKSLVSLVMREASNVSDAGRNAVLEAAAELGYRPNTMARSLVEQRSFVIGVMVSDLSNPFFIDLIEAVTDKARECGYRALVNTGGRREGPEVDAIETMLSLQVDGLVLAGPIVDVNLMDRIGAEVPTVLTNRASRSDSIDSIVLDDRLGARLAVDHLVSLGHRHIAHITGGRGAGSRNRVTGFRAGIRAHRLPEDALVASGSYTEEGGVQGARRLLASGRPFTAILAPNDLAALGAVEVLAGVGLQVPQDVSIVGFDDTFLSGLRHIDMTSVRQDAHEMGSKAVGLLIERAQAQRAESRHLVLQPTLTVRSSTGPPSGDGNPPVGSGA